MNWMDKLERKWGRYAIPYITRYLIFANLAGYILEVAGMDSILQWLDFAPYYILRGQVWRLFTWIVVPASGLSFWSLLFMICLLMLGQNLEQGLGTFRMNVYFIGGILLSDVGGLLLYAIFRIPIYLTLYYILFSLYLMLGIFMPEAEVRLYFVLPIKMKWLMLVYALTLGYEVFSYFRQGAAIAEAYGLSKLSGAWTIGMMYSAEIIFALVNLFLFVYFCKNRVSHRQKKRQKQFRSQFSEPRPGSGIAKHKCAICGRTEQDDPTLTFRFCSKCEGNYEYCQEHLFTHTHVRRM
jgi:hypothetical protein